MTLEETLLSGRRLVIECTSAQCRAHTPIDGPFLARRYGLNRTLAAIETRLICAGCGMGAVRLLAMPLKPGWSDG